jgi:hypothetical protein
MYSNITLISNLKVVEQDTLTKIWGVHFNDYEECRLLGYKNPVSPSQEPHYVSATEIRWLMLCKIWGYHGSDYGECRLLGYKNPVSPSQETHYVSATEIRWLMLCKIWGFHGSDYGECRLLGYKNPVHASQEIHYFSATEPSRLSSKIWGFHFSDYEECHLLRCDAVLFGTQCRSGRHGVKKHLLSLQEIEPRFIGLPGSKAVAQLPCRLLSIDFKFHNLDCKLT